MNRFTRGATCSQSRQLKQRHRSESSSSDGFVTRSKHKIGYDASWKTDYQWYIPVYDSVYRCSPFASNAAQIRETAQGHGQINRTPCSPPPPYVKILARTLLMYECSHQGLPYRIPLQLSSPLPECQGWPLLPGGARPPSGDHCSLQSTVVSHHPTENVC